MALSWALTWHMFEWERLCRNRVANDKFSISISFFEWHPMRWLNVCVCFLSYEWIAARHWAFERLARSSSRCSNIWEGNMIHSWAIESKWATKWVHFSSFTKYSCVLFSIRCSFVLQPFAIVAHRIQCFTSFIRARAMPFFVVVFILWSFFCFS